MQNVELNSIQRPDVMSDKPAVMQENREIDTRKQMQLEIFDSVLTVFNESLPEFLQKTVDEKSQKEYLYERLDASAKEYLERIENEAVKQCNNRWEQERRRLLQPRTLIPQKLVQRRQSHVQRRLPPLPYRR